MQDHVDGCESFVFLLRGLNTLEKVVANALSTVDVGVSFDLWFRYDLQIVQSRSLYRFRYPCHHNNDNVDIIIRVQSNRSTLCIDQPSTTTDRIQWWFSYVAGSSQPENAKRTRKVSSFICVGHSEPPHGCRLEKVFSIEQQNAQKSSNSVMTEFVPDCKEGVQVIEFAKTTTTCRSTPVWNWVTRYHYNRYKFLINGKHNDFILVWPCMATTSTSQISKGQEKCRHELNTHANIVVASMKGHGLCFTTIGVEYIK